MKITDFDITVRENKGGGCIARCEDIQGAFAEGDTPEDAIANCVGVIDMIIAYKRERNEQIPLGEQRETDSVLVSIPVLEYKKLRWHRKLALSKGVT